MAARRAPAFVWLTTIAWGALAAFTGGCQDPCVTLAERICNCQPTLNERETCRRERIATQQSVVVIDAADRALCEAKLDTCNCTALDTNDLDACGFAPASDEAESGE